MSFASPAAGDAARRRSAEVRGAHAACKRYLAAMAPTDAREVAARMVEDPDDVLRPMRTTAVLCAIPAVGSVKATSYLRRAQVRGDRVTLGALSVRERMALAALLRVPRRDRRADRATLDQPTGQAAVEGQVA